MFSTRRAKVNTQKTGLEMAIQNLGGVVPMNFGHQSVFYEDETLESFFGRFNITLESIQNRINHAVEGEYLRPLIELIHYYGLLFIQSQNNYDTPATPIESLRDSNGNTLLHYAALYQNEALAEKLMRNGADPYIKNNAGQTPQDILADIPRPLFCHSM